MTRPRISIVTPSFNQGKFIERTLESVLTQRGEFDLEYLVVDGGSSDSTLEILRRYGERIKWTSEPDKGQVDAINKGFARVSGDILGWVNSDDVLRPGALQRIIDAFRKNPTAEWVHGECDIIDADDRIIRRWVTTYKNWRCRRYSYARLVTENFISQMTVFWKRSALERVGTIDAGLHLAFDYDLWLRFGRHTDPVFIPQRLAAFRWYETSKSGANYRKQFAEDMLIARRYAPEHRWLYVVKRLKTYGILTVYNFLALLRRVGRVVHPGTAS